MTSTLPEARSAPAASDALEDYLATCKEACDGEINRLYGPGKRGSNGLYDLILDYPLRGGKALRPALSIATCLGLGGHLEAVLPTAATLELYHNAFLIHDDIEDESGGGAANPRCTSTTASPSPSTSATPCCRCRCNRCSTTSSASASARRCASCAPSPT